MGLSELLVGDVDIIRIEISRFDWAGMTCGCGRDADHIPRDFLSALSKAPADRAGEDWADNHAYIQSNLMAPAIPTASMVMSALAADVPTEHRRNLLAVLQSLACGEQEDIAEKCLDVIRGGTWLLYEEITSGRSIDAAAYAYEILDLMEEEHDRLRRFHDAAENRLPHYLR
ncbi:hypothetical protein [Streptomyces spirodelae]|uniref:Uncharacterized protein n=1 Tax=Streptomyces spirodelae TaxID=2812904 RepID=A0ABS3WM98_9ACTN|nr:hypothetical protein [Streptomyces spirodelae]MBO8184228.1 hypothetical protein [Streptomyces spirodelae]